MKNETIDKPQRKEGKGTDANRDPLTKEPGAHPVGTGIGAAAGGAAGGIAAGAAAGAAIGTGAAGPVGTAVGIVAGAVVGGLAGKAVAEKVDPTVEDAYWKDNYRNQDYISDDDSWELYGPAYRSGYEGYSRYSDRSFDDAEPELRRDWERSPSSKRLGWDKARFASRDAWERVSQPSSRAGKADAGCGCGD